MSKVFSFTPDYEYYIDADEVIKGGTGYAITMENGVEKYAYSAIFSASWNELNQQ